MKGKIFFFVITLIALSCFATFFTGPAEAGLYGPYKHRYYRNQLIGLYCNEYGQCQWYAMPSNNRNYSNHSRQRYSSSMSEKCYEASITMTGAKIFYASYGSQGIRACNRISSGLGSSIKSLADKADRLLESVARSCIDNMGGSN